MRIAVCDDERYALDKACALLNKYRQDKSVNISIELYETASELTDKCRGGVQYDIILLDILMPGITGIAAAQEIRKYNKTAKIVFLTSSHEYALDSYSVKAAGYILKPIMEDKLFACLDDLASEINIEKEKFITIKTAKGISRILLSNLEYCEIYNKTIYFHMCDKTVLDAAGTMSQTENALRGYPEFYKSHRSYIINLNFVSTVMADAVLMQSGGKIPVPYRKASEIKSAVLKYLMK
ncbi:MAG: LytTR family DNA-binding domain-containing protein [Clostridia bacterium]